MSGRPAGSSEGAPPRVVVPRVVVIDGEDVFDVFDVEALSGDVLRARSAFLFEIGEELVLRIEHGGSTSDAVARVRAHTGPADARVTELEISRRAASHRAGG